MDFRSCAIQLDYLKVKMILAMILESGNQNIFNCQEELLDLVAKSFLVKFLSLKIQSQEMIKECYGCSLIIVSSLYLVSFGLFFKWSLVHYSMIGRIQGLGELKKEV